MQRGWGLSSSSYVYRWRRFDVAESGHLNEHWERQQCTKKTKSIYKLVDVISYLFSEATIMYDKCSKIIGQRFFFSPSVSRRSEFFTLSSSFPPFQKLNETRDVQLLQRCETINRTV